jgi:hypothetical protein
VLRATAVVAVAVVGVMRVLAQQEVRMQQVMSM